MELELSKTALDDYHNRLDGLELAMLEQVEHLIDMPVTHRFTSGLYIREIFNPAGTLITTRIHKTEHPYVVLKGKASVFVPGEGVKHITAPYMGITKPGTRRVIFVHEDVIWVTFHPNPDNTQDLDAIEERLIERRDLLDGKTSHELAQELMAASQLAGDTR
jgi:hypothetical protein